MQLQVDKSPTLAAAVRLLRDLPKEVNKQIRQHTRAVAAPEWKKALAEEAPPSRVFHDRLVGPSAVYVGDRSIELRAGKAGMFPRETEFGAYREEYNDYARSGGPVKEHTRGRVSVRGHARGGGHVHRRTQRQFWNYTKTGRVVYPAARKFIPRVGALWVQTIVRTIHEQLEKI